jgi:signal transduction histidine kinase
MIKKLQRKFIMITMVSTLLIIFLLIGAINMINLVKMNDRLDGVITLISSNQGKIPDFGKEILQKDEPEFNAETKYQTRYFRVIVGADGSVTMTDTRNIKAVTSDMAGEYALKIMEKGKTSGFYGIYRYKVMEQANGYMLIFLDSRADIQNANQLLFTSCLVSLITLLLMFILISVFSRKAIKPIIESMEKQKLFITDAGHEIKTPLAIISANADVLELTGGENEWITSIRNQTVRLDKLVKNLLTLAKMDEDRGKLSLAQFDLSETVERAAGPFAAVAEATNKKFTMEITPDKKIIGDESSIEQLVSTLVDNAMKYSNEGGSVRVTLSSAKKGSKLEVYNTTDQIDTANLDRLFDRFYRADSSRARETGGYGIGLSIAKSIVEAHHGRITVKSEDGRSICFTVVFG